MRGIWLGLALLAGCSGEGAGGNEAVGPESQAAPAGRMVTLTGLYEGGEVRPPNQMCIIDKGAEARFGLVVWGANLHSCSGSGTATRNGNVLSLRMAGDEACTIDATISGKTVTLPQAIPDGCAYYCGERARMAGAVFTQQGDTETEAGKAKDLVGDPLCTPG